MKIIPTAIKIILNIIFFIIYFALASFWTWYFLTNVLNISYDDPNKIWYVVLVFIFIITFIFRKFFYISLKNN